MKATVGELSCRLRVRLTIGLMPESEKEDEAERPKSPFRAVLRVTAGVAKADARQVAMARMPGSRGLRLGGSRPPEQRDGAGREEGELPDGRLCAGDLRGGGKGDGGQQGQREATSRKEEEQQEGRQGHAGGQDDEERLLMRKGLDGRYQREEAFGTPGDHVPQGGKASGAGRGPGGAAGRVVAGAVRHAGA